MQAFVEILPPTAVTSAICLPFIRAESRTLVVAKSTLLQLFEVVDTAEESGSQTITKGSDEEEVQSRQGGLVLVGEYPLSGVVTSLAAIKTIHSKNGTESLLISFKDAKVSFVEWDAELHGISTISVHYYENEELQGVPWASSAAVHTSYLTVDPSSRCAALKFGQRHIAILPIRQAGDELMAGEYDADENDMKIDGDRAYIREAAADSAHAPFSPSFVLPTTLLDPGLTHPIDIAFLHEYREPTVGILSNATSGAWSLLQEHKDTVSFAVFTLDIEQRARTQLLSIAGLPSDLRQLVPLSLPIGGVLLVGDNVIVHVDQSGKSHAVGVNEYARQISSFSISDQSSLGLRLEGCIVEQLPHSNDLLIILASGDAVALNVHTEGRSVSGLRVKKLSSANECPVFPTNASCIATVQSDMLFVGSQLDKSSLIRFQSKSQSHLQRKRSHAEMLDIEDKDSEDEDEEDLADDDDLYGDDTQSSKTKTGQFSHVQAENLEFSIVDKMQNLTITSAPIFGALSTASVDNDPKGDRESDREIVMPVGDGSTGALAFLSKGIRCNLQHDRRLPKTKNIWTFQIQAQQGNAKKSEYLICAHDADTESSSLHAVTDQDLAEVEDTEFEKEIQTLHVGIMGNGTRVVQVTKTELRSYDTDFKLSQMLPMLDEESEEELRIVHTSFSNPYALVVRDDNSVMLLQLDKKGELDELECGASIRERKWISGSLVRNSDIGSETSLYLLATDGSLHIYLLSDLNQPRWTAEGLNLLPRNIGPDLPVRRSATRMGLNELLVTTLDINSSKSICLIVRCVTGEVVTYTPYWTTDSEKGKTGPFDGLRWLRVALTQLEDVSSDNVEEGARVTHSQMRAFRLCERYSGVLVPQSGRNAVLLRERHALPKLLELGDSKICAVSDIQSGIGDLLFVKETGEVSIMNVSKSATYEYGVAVERIDTGFGVDCVCFFEPTNHYVLSANERVQFELPEDDFHQEWAREETSLPPTIKQSTLKLLNSSSRRIIQSIIMDDFEVVQAIVSANLEVSEYTRERKDLIAVGTAIVKGEDLPATGNIFVYDIIPVVPEPGLPETGFHLKQIASQEVRGAVTGLSAVQSHGFLLVAQGQKIMVRGLREDGTLPPVAFLDVLCYTTSLKCLPSTPLMLMGDAIKGLWMGGFSDEPYKLQVFGKSKARLSVLAADFLPQERQLYLIVMDGDNNLHVLEYNPDNPNTLSGQLLLHRASFHTGHSPVSLTLRRHMEPTPSTPADPNGDAMEDQPTRRQTHTVLLASSTGSLSSIVPLTEPAYRRLVALQTYLTSFLDHPCGLNPRAHRAPVGQASVYGVGAAESGGQLGGGGGFGLGGTQRGVVDGTLIARWRELNAVRRAEMWGRVGEDAKADVDALIGRGLPL